MASEIASWSDIPSLGKSSTECPTKSEIVALSTTTKTIKIANTYSDNELVALSDISVITYQIVVTSPATIAAIGGSTTSKITYNVLTDGVVTSSGNTLTGYTITESSDSTGRFSATGTSGTVTITATNNTTISEGIAKYTISKSGYGSATISVTQSAGVQTKTIIITPDEQIIGADGGSTQATVSAYVHWNGTYTSTESSLIGYTITENSDTSNAFTATGTNGTITFTATVSTTNSNREASYTISKSGYTSATTSITQSSASIKYGTWTISLSASSTTVAAKGGSSTITATATRTYGYGTTSGAGTETGSVTLSLSSGTATLSGSTLTFANNTTTSSRSAVVKVTCTNDTSITKTITITQSAGSKSYTYGAWTITASASPTTVAASGGTSTVTHSASRTVTYTWNGVSGSGSSSTETGSTTIALVNAIGTLSGNVVTFANNTSASTRTQVITITCTNDTSVTKQITITQSAGSVEYKINHKLVATSGIAAAGGSLNYTMTYDTYWNGVKTNSGTSLTGYTISGSNTGFTATGTSGIVTITANNNKSTSTRSATYTISKSGYTSTIISAKQLAGEETGNELVINDTFSIQSSVSAKGGTGTYIQKPISWRTYWNDTNDYTETIENDYTSISQPTWVIFNSGVSDGSNITYNVSIPNNTTTFVREGNIIASFSPITKKFPITQAAGTMTKQLVLSEVSEIPAKGGSVTSTVTYDTYWNGVKTASGTQMSDDYDIAEDGGDIDIITPSDLQGSIAFLADNNCSTSSKTAYYCVNCSGYDDSDSIKITQAAGSKSYIYYLETSATFMKNNSVLLKGAPKTSDIYTGTLLYTKENAWNGVQGSNIFTAITVVPTTVTSTNTNMMEVTSLSDSNLTIELKNNTTGTTRTCQLVVTLSDGKTINYIIKQLG